MAEPKPTLTVEELIEFIDNTMRMSHIYQPLLIQSLVESGGQATLRELAVKFLREEEAEIKEMMKTIKTMPVHVLSAKNKNRKKPIVEEKDGVVRLLAKPADLKERAEILGACARKLHEYVARRGEGIWNHKWLDSPAGGAMRLRVLEAGGRRCAICGATHKDRLLDVDHIIPRSKGGPSTFENLQVLCSKCNRSKGNRSQRDFRAAEPSATHQDCHVCAMPTLTDFSAENELARAVWIDTRTGPQLCILPKRHVHAYVDLTSHEVLAMHDLLRVIHNRDAIRRVSTVLVEENHVRIALHS
jgi:ATP adenylyltransferase